MHEKKEEKQRNSEERRKMKCFRGENLMVPQSRRNHPSICITLFSVFVITNDALVVEAEMKHVLFPAVKLLHLPYNQFNDRHEFA